LTAYGGNVLMVVLEGRRSLDTCPTSYVQSVVQPAILP
jgi:hypothetical protein